MQAIEAYVHDHLESKPWKPLSLKAIFMATCTTPLNERERRALSPNIAFVLGYRADFGPRNLLVARVREVKGFVDANQQRLGVEPFDLSVRQSCGAEYQRRAYLDKLVETMRAGFGNQPWSRKTLKEHLGNRSACVYVSAALRLLISEGQIRNLSDFQGTKYKVV